MSLPKLSDFMGKGLNKVEYKRVSLIHSIKNSLARNTISQSSDNKNKLHPLQSLRNSNPNQTVNQTSSIFKCKYLFKIRWIATIFFIWVFKRWFTQIAWTSVYEKLTWHQWYKFY